MCGGVCAEGSNSLGWVCAGLCAGTAAGIGSYDMQAHKVLYFTANANVWSRRRGQTSCFRSLGGLPREQNVLIFKCFEQCFPIFEVTSRLAWRAECIDVYMISAMFSYLLGHSDDWQGVQNVLIFK